MEHNLCLIPTNFTDAGKLFGMFEIRNAIECAILCIPLLMLVIALSPFGLTGTIILGGILLIPAGGFALLGVRDHSLFTFLRLFLIWRKRRGILIYRGETIRKQGGKQHEKNQGLVVKGEDGNNE